ncbi:MAG: sensor histidine kinase [Thermoleophilaceae bacterium]
MALGRLLAWTGACVAVLLAVASVSFNLLAGDHGASVAEIALGLPALLGAAAFGLLIALRRPGNAVGWILLADAVILGFAVAAPAYARYALLESSPPLTGGRLAALWDTAGWPALFAGVVAVAYVFPDGRLPSPRWRPVAVGAVAAFTGMLVVTLFRSEPLDRPFQQVERPLPSLPATVLDILQPLMLAGLLAALIGGALAIRARLKRAIGIERLQLRWLAWACALVPLTIVVCIVDELVTGQIGVVTGVWLTLVELAIPAAIGIALLRHGLYDLDRLVARTVAWTGLTVLLAAVYALAALVLGVVAGGDSNLATAGATLTVAAAFKPLRERIQRVVDHRFDRVRYEALRTVEQFLQELRAGTAAPEDVGAVLRSVLGDTTLEVAFWLPDARAYVDSAGHFVDLERDAGRAHTPVRQGTAPVAVVRHDPGLGARPQLLEAVIAAAGLALEVARLRVQVRRQLAEVESSRARILTAGDEERRRLERDLHDGAQQRLVSIGLAMRHAQHELTERDETASATLDAAVKELESAIDDLRATARGLRPSGLDAGLTPALSELAARSAIPVQLDVDVPERLDSKIETAAYFVACEALTNVAKHADAAAVALSAHRHNGTLLIAVEDDGVGGAVATSGSGLEGIRDRVEAHGGRLSLESPSGGGTRVRAELPCA